MTETGKPTRAAHRARPQGLQTKPLLWGALAATVVVVLFFVGLLVPWGCQDEQRTEGMGALATPTRAPERPPVVVGPSETPASTWTDVLANPSVELGCPHEDEGTQAAIARALYEAREDAVEDEKLRATFTLRDLDDSEQNPDLEAAQRLDNARERAMTQPSERPKPGAPAEPDELTLPREAAEPGAPEESNELTEPDALTESDAPAEPQRNEPAEGTVPSAAALSREPAQPGAPADPDVAAERNDPALPGGPAEPNEPAQPGEPAEGNAPAEPGKPEGANEVAEPAEPGESRGQGADNPAPAYTVVTRQEWETWASKNPNNGLVASTPGGRADSDFPPVDETTLQESLDM